MVITALDITLLFLSACLICWYALSLLGKPRIKVIFDSVDFATYTENTRVLTNQKLTDNIQGRQLRLGVNDFYVMIDDGVISYHELHESNTLNPILRGTEDRLFFRVRVEVVGNRVVDVRQTSLSKANATLQWHLSDITSKRF